MLKLITPEPHTLSISSMWHIVGRYPLRISFTDMTPF